MERTNKKIGEILLANKAITEEVLGEALSVYYEFGIGVTAYLISHKHITEEELARSLTKQFKIPYLPLKAYAIPYEVVHSIPVEIAKKYYIMPVDRMDDILTVVMSNPFDSDAIEELQEITGCTIQPFVGLFSEIIKAIGHYYYDDENALDMEQQSLALFKYIKNKGYKGVNRRRANRIKVDMDTEIFGNSTCARAKIENLSTDGILFSSEDVEFGAYPILHLTLPKTVLIKSRGNIKR